MSSWHSLIVCSAGESKLFAGKWYPTQSSLHEGWEWLDVQSRLLKRDGSCHFHQSRLQLTCLKFKLMEMGGRKQNIRDNGAGIIGAYFLSEWRTCRSCMIISCYWAALKDGKIWLTSACFLLANVVLHFCLAMLIVHKSALHECCIPSTEKVTLSPSYWCANKSIPKRDIKCKLYKPIGSRSFKI